AYNYRFGNLDDSAAGDYHSRCALQSIQLSLRKLREARSSSVCGMDGTSVNALVWDAGDAILCLGGETVIDSSSRRLFCALAMCRDIRPVGREPGLAMWRVDLGPMSFPGGSPTQKELSNILYYCASLTNSLVFHIGNHRSVRSMNRIHISHIAVSVNDYRSESFTPKALRNHLIGAIYIDKRF
ncbi:unnamed protein product, partial [Sphagnum jensenii]